MHAEVIPTAQGKQSLRTLLNLAPELRENYKKYFKKNWKKLL